MYYQQLKYMYYIDNDSTMHPYTLFGIPASDGLTGSIVSAALTILTVIGGMLVNLYISYLYIVIL